MKKNIVIVDCSSIVELLKNAKFSTTGNKVGMKRINVSRKKDAATRKGEEGRVFKVTKGNVDLFRNTEKMREKAGLEAAGPRSWGVRIPDTCLVEHKGNYYVSVTPVTDATKGAVGVALSSHYEAADGTPLSEDDPSVVAIISRKDGQAKAVKKGSPTTIDFSVQDSQIELTVDGTTYQYIP
jgi:hypothetical protein